MNIMFVLIICIYSRYVVKILCEFAFIISYLLNKHSSHLICKITNNLCLFVVIILFAKYSNFWI